jgi:hypothetical protein
MSTLPEVILQRAIINGFSALRKDPRIINMLFKNLPLAQQDKIKTFFLEKTIDFSINYPRNEIKVPAVVMLMKTEAESQEFLFDIVGVPPHYDMPDQSMTVDTLGGGTATTTSGMSGLPKLVLGGLRVASQIPADVTIPGGPTNSALTFVPDDQDLINEVFSVRSSWPCLKLHVVSGAGAGQVKMINLISSDQLDIIGTFDVNCNNTSVVDIRYGDALEAPYGQPVRSYAANGLGQIRLGANYDGQYQLEILAGNQEEVIYLYTVLKAILFAQRKFLEAEGIMALKISGTDLAPRSELLPDEIFTRTMTLQFTYPFNFIVENEVFKAIQVVLTNVNPDTATPTPSGSILVAEIDLEP